MKIRNLIESDIPVITQLMQDMPDLAPDRLSVQWLFSQFFSRTSFVSESPTGEILGFLYGFLDQDNPTRAFIYELGVVIKARRMGVASSLITAFRLEVLQRGVRTIFLTTLPTNSAALAFYKSMGFSHPKPLSKVGQDRLALYCNLES